MKVVHSLWWKPGTPCSSLIVWPDLQRFFNMDVTAGSSPVSDPEAMAEAILEALAAPPQRRELQERVRDFSIETLLPHFVEALGLNTKTNPAIPPDGNI